MITNQTLKAQAQAELNKIAYDLRHGALIRSDGPSFDGVGLSLGSVRDAMRGLDLIQEALDQLPEPSSYELAREQHIHERHLNLLASCRLCRIEAGDQPDRLVQDDE
jgi:hypothetical protein